MCCFLRCDVEQVTHCVAGNSEGFHAGTRHGGVLGLSVQMLEPVLQILFVIADHLKPLKHASYWKDTHKHSRWMTKNDKNTWLCLELKEMWVSLSLPESSKAFLWLSQSSNGVTVIPLKGSLPWEKQSRQTFSLCARAASAILTCM